MTIGTALLIIAILYLIDRHNLWKRAAQGVLVLAILAVLIAGTVYGWVGVSDWRDRNRANREMAARDREMAAKVDACVKRNTVTLPPTSNPNPWDVVSTQPSRDACLLNPDMQPENLKVDAKAPKDGFDGAPCDNPKGCPIVNGHMVYLHNFVKCGLDVDGQIITNSTGACIPPPPDNSLIVNYDKIACKFGGVETDLTGKPIPLDCKKYKK